MHVQGIMGMERGVEIKGVKHGKTIYVGVENGKKTLLHRQMQT